MDLPEILSRLERNEGRFPRIAIQEAINRRDEIVPPLLGILESVADDVEFFAADGNRMAHIYAMFLLAQFRETRSYPLLVRIFSAPGELSFDLAGDVVTEQLGGILASVCGGDVGGITSLIENAEANEYVRAAAMDALVTLVACGERSREEVIGYFGELFHKLDRTPHYVWSDLACCCADLCPEETYSEIRRAYEEGLIDPFVIRWEEIDPAIALGKEGAMERLKRSRHHQLITDVVQEMEWWACFRQDGGPGGGDEHRVRATSSLAEIEPFRRRQPKVGRNDACPCGSGKKFKKCCGL